MAKFSGLLVGLCMVVIAISGGFVAQLAFGVDPGLAIGFVLFVLFIIVLGADRAARARERAELERRIDAAERDIEYLLAGAEAPEARPAQPRPAPPMPAPPRSARVEPSFKPAAPADAVGRPAEKRPPMPSQPRPSVTVEVMDEPAAQGSEAGAHGGVGPADLAAAVAAAIDRNRLEYALQAIVALPQRRPRWYELSTRLRLETGATLDAAEWTEAARGTGRLIAVDRMAFSRAVPILRRIHTRGNEVGLFCNISAETLGHGAAFAQLLSVFDDNPDLSDAIVIELSQDAVKRLGAIEIEAIRVLAERGVKLSLDAVTDLSLDFGELAEHGFRVMKIPAQTMLRDFAAAGAEIHPADFSSLLARYGIELVVSGVAVEATVVALLDYGIKYGQGEVFSPARAIRAEAFVEAGPSETAEQRAQA